MLFAAACVALVACTKNMDTTTPKGGDATAFEKGQKVTLSVNAGDQTKVSSALDVTTGAIDFKWETGDKIKVTVGIESAEFTLSSGAGTASAQFTGTMPAAGNTFDVQYPVTDPDLSSQTYVTNALPKDKMKMTATGCTIEDGFTLTPQYAALRLNLCGLNREVSQIVVTNTTANPNVSYTLTCNNTVRVGKSATDATPFCIVVPGGGDSWNFKVDITSSAATSELDPLPDYTEDLGYEGKGIIIPNNSFSTSQAQAFTAGVVRNMPTKCITIIWAPVNCGYEPANGTYKGYPYGRMYQWGRKYGLGYKDSSSYDEDDDYPRTSDVKAQTLVTLMKTEELLPTHPDGAEYNGKFYASNFDAKRNWYAGSNPDKLWNVNEGTANPVSKSDYDPCPDGWRVPTKSELEILKGTKTSANLLQDTHGTSTVKGSKFDGGDGSSADNYVFLPVAGSINFGGTCKYREHYFNGIQTAFYYWSSTVSGDNAHKLTKATNGVISIDASDGRAFGASVRCVKE